MPHHPARTFTESFVLTAHIGFFGTTSAVTFGSVDPLSVPSVGLISCNRDSGAQPALGPIMCGQAGSVVYTIACVIFFHPRFG